MLGAVGVSLQQLIENMTGARTRWLTIGTLAGVILALIGVVLCLIIIVTIGLGEPVSSAMIAGATMLTISGVVLCVVFSTALSARTPRNRRG